MNDSNEQAQRLQPDDGRKSNTGDNSGCNPLERLVRTDDSVVSHKYDWEKNPFRIKLVNTTGELRVIEGIEFPPGERVIRIFSEEENASYYKCGSCILSEFTKWERAGRSYDCPVAGLTFSAGV